MPRLRRAAGAGSDSWRHSHPLSQGIRRFAIVELQLGRHSQRVDKWWLYILIYVLTMCWQYVDSMSLPLCPCLWRLWFSRIMIWKFNGAGSGAVFLWRAKLNPKKKDWASSAAACTLTLIQIAQIAQMALHAGWYLKYAETWRLYQVEYDDTYICTYIHIYIYH